MWILLKYLIAFRDRVVPQSELIELLWSRGESDKPEGALKTQLHRLRTVLTELNLPENQDLIINTLGTYAFNNAIDYWIDTTEFEELYKKANQPEMSEKEHATCLLKAFQLYKGDFLYKSCDEKWIAPVCVYYHSMFLRVTHKLIDILYKFNRFQELTEICRKAMLIDALDPKSHCTLIKTLFESGEKQAAKKHYYYSIDLFYNQHGINPPSELITLYEEIIKSEETFEPELKVINRRLNEKDELVEINQDGAFFCEFEFFKYIYRLEIRDSKRTGRNFQLCLFTLQNKNGSVPEPKELSDTMPLLYESISKSLRASDIFARYSVSQFIVLLLSVKESSTEPVLKRITDNFNYKSNIKNNPEKNKLMIEYQFGCDFSNIV